MFFDMYFFASVVVVIGSYIIGLETLYLAKQEGMINGEFVFILFELNQAFVERYTKLPFMWFNNILLGRYRLAISVFKSWSPGS